MRQFLVTLFDRGELSQLASYPYTDMIEEVESIIESRARSADLSVNNYYDFLYSFHVSKVVLKKREKRGKEEYKRRKDRKRRREQRFFNKVVEGQERTKGGKKYRGLVEL